MTIVFINFTEKQSRQLSTFYSFWFNFNTRILTFVFSFLIVFTGIISSCKKYDSVSIQEVIDKKLAVVDLTASIMCMENKMPMYVFGLNEENSIVKAMSGEFAGTKVTV